jgi:hypothetical protein
VVPPQGLATHRHKIRQTGSKLPQRSLLGRNLHLLAN